MKIIFDVAHPAQINFFKNVIYQLHAENHKIIITYILRGNLEKIIKKEFVEFNHYCVGQNSGSFYSIIFEANLYKFFRLFIFCIKEKFNLGVSVGSFPLGFSLKLLGRNNIQFDDDPERFLNVFLEKISCEELIFPPIVKENRKIKVMNALKEWAYLSPTYFKPNIQTIKDIGVEAGKYIFVREVSNKSFNYRRQKAGIIASYVKCFPENVKVLFSLEEKYTRNKYPENWILLEEPLEDIHSILYFSKAIISSGDSMAREGALMGVPSLYCGNREMAVNHFVLEKNILFNLSSNESFKDKLNKVLNFKIDQDDFRDNLLNEWTDVTQFIIEKVHYYSKST